MLPPLHGVTTQQDLDLIKSCLNETYIKVSISKDLSIHFLFRMV